MMLAFPVLLNVMLALFNIWIFELPLLNVAVPPTVVNVRLPAPSVVIAWPEEPPVIITLPIGPKFAFADTVIPFASAMLIGVCCHTENPFAPLKGLSAILFCLV
jgi:hypothetical protein